MVKVLPYRQFPKWGFYALIWGDLSLRIRILGTEKQDVKSQEARYQELRSKMSGTRKQDIKGWVIRIKIPRVKPAKDG